MRGLEVTQLQRGPEVLLDLWILSLGGLVHAGSLDRPGAQRGQRRFLRVEHNIGRDDLGLVSVRLRGWRDLRR